MAEDSSMQKSSAKPRRVGRKSGGRAGRHAKRKQGAVGMAVRPGTEGGSYKPLSDRDIERIHVLKGPYDVRYGNFATAGSVDFTLKK